MKLWKFWTTQDVVEDVTQKQWHCPVCGYTSTTSFKIKNFDDPTLDGAHCIKCYAKWFSANVPRVEWK